MTKAELGKAVEGIKKHASEDEQVYLNDLSKAIKNGKKLSNADDYIDLLLGIAEDLEEDVQEKLYQVVEFITEEWT